VVASPSVSSPIESQLCSITHDNFISQLVVHPTRGKNILDLVFTNSPDSISSVCVVDNLSGTDHDSIEFSICVSLPNLSTCEKTLYNFKKADFCALQVLLSHIPWDQLDLESNIEDTWTRWKDLFFMTVDFIIPKSQWKPKKLKHWFTNDTLYLVRVKQHLYQKMKRNNSETNCHKYKAVSNLVRSKTRQDTMDYISSLSTFISSIPVYWYSA